MSCKSIIDACAEGKTYSALELADEELRSRS